MTNYIAIDNANTSASVALLIDNNQKNVIYQRISDLERNNSEQILPMLDELLAQASLDRQSIDGIVFSQGPGGFTGLRVACGLAQGLALGLDIPVVPVSSLEATAELSLPYIDDGFMVVALDARMHEVYLAVYDVKAKQVQENPIVSATLMQVTDVQEWINQQFDAWCLLYQKKPEATKICLAGNAMEAYPDSFLWEIGGRWLKGNAQWATADTLVRLGAKKLKTQGGLSLTELAPLYLRDKVAFTTEEREAGMGGNPKIAPPEFTPLQQRLFRLVEQLKENNYWIRPLLRSDLPAVIAIENQTQGNPWTEGMFMAGFLHLNYRLWALINSEDELLAYAIQLVDPEVVNLMTISVAPTLQQKGIGSLLLEWLEIYIQYQDTMPKVQLLEVRESNTHAQRLYQKFAYEQIGMRKNYYSTASNQKENALVLQKTLR
ncbi:peptidase M22 [Pelistega indica]|uniref:Peptidase M22 n=1 Tax=Pelistega indica TaxID=1414851 RepID=V8G982_9BURK|nr:bifunctional tRNA (adenosine(37)-N6)-threonylcarbamoyltransferase complex dimerization subunit type 1 TsaB/ribosomal protein alanine acetyltransferase RimI [Pelistega indica]ETD72493.1 peptidase M22 [Pelistega indica]